MVSQMNLSPIHQFKVKWKSESLDTIFELQDDFDVIALILFWEQQMEGRPVEVTIEKWDAKGIRLINIF